MINLDQIKLDQINKKLTKWLNTKRFLFFYFFNTKKMNNDNNAISHKTSEIMSIIKDIR